MKSYVVIILTLLFLFVMGLSAHNFAHTNRMGDEVGHMVGGHLALHGTKLYKDIHFNHQPLVYYYSSLTEAISKPDNLFNYISRQRDAVFIYAAVWELLLIAFFGLPMVFFMALFEMSKYLLSGEKLLAETLAVYPVVFVCVSLIQLVVNKKHLTSLHICILSISFFLITFSLLPLWPFVLLTLSLFIWYFRKNHRKLLYILLPFFACTIVLFVITPLSDYLRETIVYNTRYFLPSQAGKQSVFNVVMLPILSFLPPYTPIKLLFSGSIFILLIFGLDWLKNKKEYGAIILLPLLLLNTRTDFATFDNFHLLPQFGAMLATAMYLIFEAIKNNFKSNRLFISVSFVLFIGITGWIYRAFPIFYSTKPFITEQHYIFYSESETHGGVVKILKSPTDRLLVFENDPLVYWVADIHMATKVLEYYPWITTIPEYEENFVTTITQNPPEFIVIPDISSHDQVFRNRLNQVLLSSYVQLHHLNKPSKVYVHEDKVKTISDSQKILLKDKLFTIPVISLNENSQE
ncbi:hypothetical protein KBD09_00285 [Candidatus Woesebacteria bacterium]|nr:hypothetical protein [Candidatus Woesebacteria bacterium]